MTQHLSEVVKLLAINYYKNNDLTQQKVANIFSVTKRTLQNWLNAYENNTLSRKNKIGKSYKVKEKHIKLALSLIKKYPHVLIKKYPHVSIQSLWIMQVLIEIKKYIIESGNELHYSIPYKPKTNAIETWFSQFKHHLIQKQGKGVTFRHLKNTIKTVIASIDYKSYTNIMKYAYKNKDNRKTIRKVSTRRRKSKQYIS